MSPFFSFIKPHYILVIFERQIPIGASCFIQIWGPMARNYFLRHFLLYTDAGLPWVSLFELQFILLTFEEYL